jgi:hypothetical protein
VYVVWMTCVCVRVCMYVCMYVCVYVCMYVCTLACMNVHIDACMCIHTYIYIYIYTYTCILIYKYQYMCLYIYVHIHAHIPFLTQKHTLNTYSNIPEPLYLSLCWPVPDSDSRALSSVRCCNVLGDISQHK